MLHSNSFHLPHVAYPAVIYDLRNIITFIRNQRGYNRKIYRIAFQRTKLE